MAERETEQLGYRVEKDLLVRMRRYAAQHHLKPSMTTLLENAMREWLEQHESELGQESAAKKKSK